MVQGQNALGVRQAPPPPAVPPEVKLDFIIQQLQRLVEIGEQLIGQVPIVIEPKIVPGLVSVPLEPEILNHAIQAMRIKGESFFPTVRLTWSCPAGATTIFPIGVPAGYVCTCTTYVISSDFYDPNILVNAFVDDELMTPFGIILTGLSEMDYAEHHIKHREVRFETTNNTATNAQLSVHVKACFLEKSYYEQFYVPIINYMRSVLEGVAYGQV